MGPSLELERAREILDADYRPPVKRGDLMALPPEVDTVGIIDGVLLTDAAVGHREILSLLDRGVKVYGASSMGALRAAELSDLGMIGIGRIFAEYASGRINGDDEVVLAYDPFSQRALSEPLINLRLNLEAAAECGIISTDSVESLIASLKHTYYPKRTYDYLYQISKIEMKNEELEALVKFLKNEGMDYKQNDAILLLRAVKDGCDFF
ncbi:MAG: TfuA-related McrA-glycine thioamidation protein [Methanomassiliicoccus sp.]|nr:TfuA-related McrA-glycine thioamidation protein [Methanomassiliicoccus sp.]